MNWCLSGSDRPSVLVKYQERYVGKIVETTICNCCCLVEQYQALEIQGANGQVLFRVVSRNPQNGHLLILPCCDCEKIVWDIIEGSE